MINKEHLDAFLDAMHRRDASATEAHMADDVVIYSPIVPEPFKGKQQVQEVLKQLVLIVNAFTPKQLLQDGADFVAIFTIELGPNKLDGMDHMHLNEAGFIDSMTVAWRPLPAVVEVQKRLAPAFGMAPLTLVPMTQAVT
jgi:SnoaL-like domain